MAELQLTDIRKSFGLVDVIKGVDLTIESGEFMVFVGPSGCGKSTLLRLIAGLEDITSGTLSFDGEVVNRMTPPQRGISMVFQSYALYPHMKVYENMAFGLQLDKSSDVAIRARIEAEREAMPAEAAKTQPPIGTAVRRERKKEVERRVLAAAELLQITPYLDRLPKQLSGGQRQRVAIGRAIVRDPKVFLFDEPLSNLDAALRVATRLEIAKLHHSMNNVTMIYVTHDQVEAMTLADRICVLRDGLIEQVGTPVELYENPQSLFVAGFIGSPKMNFVNGARAASYGAQTIGLRSEHIEIGTGENAWTGKVIHSENLGSDSYVYVDIGEAEPLIVREDSTQGAHKHQPDEAISVRPQKGKVYRFDGAGAPLARA